MRTRPKKSYRSLHRQLEGGEQRPYRPVSALAHYWGWLCEEFPGRLPTELMAEQARLPEGFLEEIILSRYYGRAVSANQVEPKGWKNSPMRTTAMEIELEIAAEEIARG